MILLLTLCLDFVFFYMNTIQVFVKSWCTGQVQINADQQSFLFFEDFLIFFAQSRTRECPSGLRHVKWAEEGRKVTTSKQ